MQEIESMPSGKETELMVKVILTLSNEITVHQLVPLKGKVNMKGNYVHLCVCGLFRSDTTNLLPRELKHGCSGMWSICQCYHGNS